MDIKKKYIASLLFLLLALLCSCTRQPSRQIELALGTVCTVVLYEGGSKQAFSRIFARIREIDRTMTAYPGEFESLFDDARFDPDSNTAETLRAITETLTSGVVAINRQAGIEPVKARADLIKVLETALEYAALSDGAFDPTIGPLVQLWGIGTDTQRIPDEAEIAAALELVNWRDVVIDHEAGTVFLRREGMALDLGAIAKGYAGDEALRVAKTTKVKRAVFDLGGNIVTLGYREGGRTIQKKDPLPWRIGIQNPLKGRGAYIGVVSVHDMSVVTSGVYERFFERDGRRYHHLLSTVDGYPVENGLLSVTIVTESSMLADALSTTVFVLGYERGRALIDSVPNTSAIFVFTDRNVKITDGLEGIFSLTDGEFTLVR